MSDHSMGTARPPESSNPHRIHFLSALAAIKVPNKLLRGVEVVIVAANGKTKPALLRISVDRFTIHINPIVGSDRITTSARSAGFFSRRATSAGDRFGSSSSIQTSSSYSSSSSNNMNYNIQRAVDIGELARVQRGQSTQHFEQAKKNVDKFETILHRGDLLTKTSSSRSLGPGSVLVVPGNMSSGSSVQTNQTVITSTQLDPNLSFSMIFRGAHTLDLMASSEEERNEICDALDRILKAYQRGKTRVSTDVLLLRYIWLDVDKEKSGYVTCMRFGQVLAAINFATMKQRDLIAAYEKFGKVIGLDRSKRKQGLTFEQSATFLHKVRHFIEYTS